MNLDSLIDTRKGQTALVMGNGESLNSIPRPLLDRFESFGTNHIYLCGIQPTYYVCVDSRVLTEHASAIYNVASRAKLAFLSSLFSENDQPATKSLYSLPNVCLFSKDESAFREERFLSGSTGVYVALKMAYYLGFDTALLFGVDHDEGWKHCADDYPPGVTTSESKKEQMRWHLQYASEVFRSSRRRILNFSLPSQLDSFYDRGHLEDWGPSASVANGA